MWLGLLMEVSKIPEYQRNTGMTISRNHMMLKYACHTQFLKALTKKLQESEHCT